MPSLKEVHQQFFEARIQRERERLKKAEAFFDDLEREDAQELRLFPLGAAKEEPGSTVVAPAVDPAATLPAPVAAPNPPVPTLPTLPAPAGPVQWFPPK